MWNNFMKRFKKSARLEKVKNKNYKNILNDLLDILEKAANDSSFTKEDIGDLITFSKQCALEG